MRPVSSLGKGDLLGERSESHTGVQSRFRVIYMCRSVSRSVGWSVGMSVAFLSSSISTANLSRLVDASFSSLALLSSFVSMANLSCLLATTFSSHRLLSNSLSSPRFNLLRVARCCFLWFLFSHLILSLSFLCLQSLKLCLLQVSHI